MKFIHIYDTSVYATVDRWKIYTDDINSYHMGEIEWDFTLRQYVFVPSGISLSAAMTREVCDFIDQEAARRISALRSKFPHREVVAEQYPGQLYFHQHNNNIRKAEEEHHENRSDRN